MISFYKFFADDFLIKRFIPQILKSWQKLSKPRITGFITALFQYSNHFHSRFLKYVLF